MLRARVADVTKPLVAVRELVAAGCALRFDASGASLSHVPSGLSVPLLSRHGVWIARVRLLPRCLSPLSLTQESSYAGALLNLEGESSQGGASSSGAEVAASSGQPVGKEGPEQEGQRVKPLARQRG